MSGIPLLILRILATLSLYAFTGWALYLLWRDLQIQGALLSARKVIPLSLHIHTADQPSKTLHFTRNEIIIGRQPECHCVLADEAASAHHARLSHHHNQWWVEDLQSTNGTKLNGERITVPTVIISGDSITCGHTTLTVQIAGDAPLSSTTPL